MKKIFVILACIVVCFNLPPIKPFIEVFLLKGTYAYTTINQSFYDSEMLFKGRTYQTVERNFDNFKVVCGECDVVLYRTFIKTPWKFWLWGEYILYKKYRLPYISLPGGYKYKTIKYRCQDRTRSI
jgi:hypothetical protein